MKNRVHTGEAVFVYTEADLLFEYQDCAYSPNDPRISGEPDQTLFDRSKCDEMLYMVNSFALRRNFRDKRSFAKTEKLLNLYVPDELVTQQDVLQWIEEHWFDFL